MKKIFPIVALLLLLYACASPIYIERDAATQARYVKLKIHLKDNRKYEPYYRQTLTFVKESTHKNTVSYVLYDAIKLLESSFDIDTEKMYLIVDNEVFPMTNSYEKQYNNRSIHKNTQEVMQADSTKISVVTGYDEVTKKVYQMTHSLSSEMIRCIENARIVILRYSAGPDLINSEIEGRDLKHLKQLITKDK